MFKILRKDFIVYWIFVLIGFIGQLTLSSVMIIYGRDDSWRTFVFVGCVQIATVILFYLVYEKMRNFDKMLFSLPLTKNQILLSKYFGSLLIMLTGLIFWYLTANYIDYNFLTVPEDLSRFLNIKTLLIIIVFFSLFISFFVPLTITVKPIYVLIVPLIFIAYLYVKAAGQLSTSSYTEIQLMNILFLILAVIIPFCVSYFVSVKLLNNRDIV